MDYYTFGELPDDTSNIDLEDEFNENKTKISPSNASGWEDQIRNNFINKKQEILRPVDPKSFSSFRLQDWSLYL